MTGERRGRMRGAADERASPADVVMLAIDRGPVPQQMGVVLVLDAGCDLDAVGHAIVERARGVPRLRQRLRRAPLGCGRPFWSDEPWFDPSTHLERVTCPAAGDERALLDLAAAVVGRRLPRSRPLWRAVLVSGLADGRCAVVLVAHHAVADGLRGLATLLALADGVPEHPAADAAAALGRRAPVADAAPRPTAGALRATLAAVRRMPGWWRALRLAVAASGGLRSPQAAACSLLRPTGPRRRLATCRADLAALHSAAHELGGTVNDAAMSAVAGALHVLLARRGEQVPVLRVAVPVGARSTTADQGNAVTPVVVGLPACGDVATRCRGHRGPGAAARPGAEGPSMLTLLAPVVRWVAALGGYRYYLTHQRRLHTLFSNLRGPARPFALAGARVRAMIPVVVGDNGNIAVTFVAVSYAGTLTVTIVADPDAVPDLDALAEALQDELDQITGRAGSPPAAADSRS